VTTGAIVDLFVTIFIGVLFTAIAFLLRGRFDAQDIAISNLRTTVETNSLALAVLTESQKAIIENQRGVSHAQSKLINEAEDLEDVTDQLDHATKRLRDQWERHEKFLLTLGYKE
jgi:Skp family chaperone for outer membrane proteins